MSINEIIFSSYEQEINFYVVDLFVAYDGLPKPGRAFYYGRSL